MRREKPIKRRNLPARSHGSLATGRDGKRYTAKLTWDRGKGTHKRKAEAQQPIR